MSSLTRVRMIARQLRTAGLRSPSRRWGALLVMAILPAIAAAPALDDGTDAPFAATADTTAAPASATPEAAPPDVPDDAGNRAPDSAPAGSTGEPRTASAPQGLLRPAPAQIPEPISARMPDEDVERTPIPDQQVETAPDQDEHAETEPRPDAPAETAPAPDPVVRTAPAIAPRATVTVPTPAARAIPTIEPLVTLAPAPANTAGPAVVAIAPPGDATVPDGVATGQLSGARPPADGVSAQPPEPAGPPSAPAVAPFKLLGETLAPGSFAQLTWYGTETFTSTSIPSAVLVAHGSTPGPVICITAAIHGDELNGIETVRRIMHDLDPTRLSGTVIGVPIVNIQGFHRGTRYLPDRRDLNRYFPGNPNGSSASRIAYSLFYNVIVFCNALVDLHTGSFHRTNLPQVRANLNDPGALALTQGFGSTVILHSDGEGGTLRAAATRAGIPAVTFEAGAPMQVQEEAVRQTEQGIRTLLDTLGVYRQPGLRTAPAPAYYQSRWVRTDHGGILSGRVGLGSYVAEGDLLGTVVDPLTNQQQEIRSPLRGRVIGMALDQFVMPGYATFHIGIAAPVEEVIESTPGPEPEHEAAEVEPETGADPA